MKYKIIYCDPPWSFYNDSDSYFNKTTKVGMRKPPYNVLSTKNIMELPVKEIAEDDSILLIWTTDYHLEKCLKVINEWGYTYKTVGFYWAKKTKSNTPVCFMGAYTMKSGIEMCLLATRGKNAHKLVKEHNIRGLVESQREEHSKKPDEIRKRIEKLFGNVSRIELFATKKVDGWKCLGYNINKKDIREELNNIINE